MIKEAFNGGIQEAYFKYIEKNPTVKEALYKQARIDTSNLIAGGVGLLGGAGLGAGAMALVNRHKQKQQQAQEEAALQQAIMQSYAAYPESYFGGGY